MMEATIIAFLISILCFSLIKSAGIADRKMESIYMLSMTRKLDDTEEVDVTMRDISKRG